MLQSGYPRLEFLGRSPWAADSAKGPFGYDSGHAVCSCTYAPNTLASTDCTPANSGSVLGFGALVLPGRRSRDTGAFCPRCNSRVREPRLSGSAQAAVTTFDRAGRPASWHAAGYRGQGIKIAILDTGFRGYRAHLGHALPNHVTVHSFRSDGDLEAKDSQHGILCGEVVHALRRMPRFFWPIGNRTVPISSWTRSAGPASRVPGLCPVRSSCRAGVMAREAVPCTRRMADLLGSGREAGDLLFFASAGNTAQRHWSGTFHDGGHGFHAWQSGKEENGLSPWGTQKVSIELCWQTSADYDLYVYDRTAAADVAQSLAQNGTLRSCAVARFLPQAQHTYVVRIRLAHGPVGPFHLVALGAGLQFANARGSIPFPADGPAVVAVGAVSLDGHRLLYSSCGPNSPQPKPDLVAPVPFPSLWRAQPFSGTLASAPQAAALAALWWCRYPSWTATQVRAALCSAAHDLGPPGHDYETGYGLIALP